MAPMLNASKTPRKHLTSIQKQQIIGAYRAGTSQRQVAAIFNVSQRQVNYTVNNEVPSPRSGRPRKSDSDSDQTLIDVALAKPEQPMRELQMNHAPTLSRSTIKRRLREHGITKRVQVQRPLLLPHHRDLSTRQRANPQVAKSS